MTALVRVFTPRSPSRAPEDAAKQVGADVLFQHLGLTDDRIDLVRRVQDGLPAAVVGRLASELRVPQQTLLRIVRIAPATLARRRASVSGRLSAEESDRVYRVAAAYRDALQLFEDNAAAARGWLNEPARALGGETPFRYLDTEAGAAAVHNLIGRLEHGVYT